MVNRKTYLDSNILIAAFQGNDEIAKKALETIEDIEREFVISDYLKLETIPKPTFMKFQEEVEFMKTFFESADRCLETSVEITAMAIDLASRFDLGPMDALHISTAIFAGAEDFITLEKDTKPMFKVDSIDVISLYSSP